MTLELTTKTSYLVSTKSIAPLLHLYDFDQNFTALQLAVLFRY